MGRSRLFILSLLHNLLIPMPTAFGWWVSVGSIGGTPRGHEEITWQGTAMANALLGSHGKTADGMLFFPTPPRADGGGSSNNYLLIGNFSVDRPDDHSITSTDEVMNLRKAFSEYYGISGAIDWHHAVQMQALHFMRQFDENEAWSSRYSCEKGKEVIMFSSTRAVANWTEAFNPEKSAAEKQRSRERAQFWIGVALHTIQDAFSPVHVEREVGPKAKIKQLCTYEKEFPGVCHHKTVDTHDNVWAFGTPPASLENTPEASAGIIQLPAQMAALATRDYLRKMAMQFEIGSKWVDRGIAISTAELRAFEFFHDAEPEGAGRFWCPISPVLLPNKDFFQFGEVMKIQFKEQVGLGPNPYLGLLRTEAAHIARPLAPNTEPDADVVSWYPFDGTVQESGNVTFDALRAGDFEVRLFDTEGQEKMVTGMKVAPGLRLPETSITAGSSFQMEFGADARWPVNAFLALVPVATAETVAASKAAAIQFLKLNQMENETVTVTAPAQAGTYEMRMFASGAADGALVARATLQIL